MCYRALPLEAVFLVVIMSLSLGPHFTNSPMHFESTTLVPDLTFLFLFSGHGAERNRRRVCSWH